MSSGSLNQLVAATEAHDFRRRVREVRDGVDNVAIYFSGSSISLEHLAQVQ